MRYEEQQLLRYNALNKKDTYDKAPHCVRVFLISEGNRRSIVSVQTTGTRIHLCTCELQAVLISSLPVISSTSCFPSLVLTCGLP